MKKTLCVAVTEENKKNVTILAAKERKEKNKIMEIFVNNFFDNYNNNNKINNNKINKYFKKNKGLKYNMKLILRLENEKRYKLKEICAEKEITFQELINNIILVNLNKEGD